MDTSKKVSTELEAALQTIDDLQRQLVQSRLALEEFTSSVSHDLRAPLRHVNSYLKIIREDLGHTIDPVIASHLKTAGDAAAHMARLMDGLLELSRVGRAQLQLSDVALQPLVSELLEKLAPEIGARAFEWRVAPDLPVVRGDLALLGQMLLRLLANAVKFTRDGPAAVVEVGWAVLGAGWCEVYVQDNGAGFDPRFADRLFRVFQRLHSPKQFEGIGVGLALARLVVERHGGAIRAQGSPESGCRISLSLPLVNGAPA